MKLKKDNMLRKIYSEFRKILPRSFKGYFTRAVFVLSGKPFVKKKHHDMDKLFPGGQKGGLIISADFEMAWAFRYSKRNKNYLELAHRERENVPVIVKLCERYNIPVTWATVGHLFLESCSVDDHSWMERIPYFDKHWLFDKGDWFDHDPCTNFKDSPEWYAPDLIKMIHDSKVNHEFGCHSFSHIHCADEICPPKVFEDELRASKDAASNFGLVFKSFVFPGGTVGNLRVLKKFGYKIYRKNLSFDLCYPYYDDHGILITASSHLLGDSGHGWSDDYTFGRIKKFIDKAVQTGTVCHLWFHPSVDKHSLNNIFPQVFAYIDSLRSKRKLWVGTMGEIADHIESCIK